MSPAFPAVLCISACLDTRPVAVFHSGRTPADIIGTDLIRWATDITASAVCRIIMCRDTHTVTKRRITSAGTQASLTDLVRPACDPATPAVLVIVHDTVTVTVKETWWTVIV